MIKHVFSILILAVILLSACVDSDKPQETSDSFDRTVMMENWVDDFIGPGYVKYVDEIQKLQLAFSEFQQVNTMESLSSLRSAYIQAYTSWQLVSMFEIGEAEKLGLRNNTNIFPTDTEMISSYIETGEYNLSLPSSRPAQGFPALDYLLFNGTSDQDLLISLSSDSHSIYIGELIDRLLELGSVVRDSWTADRRIEFSTDRESTDRMINDYLYFYEKFLRAGKVGIPAGVFSGDALPQNVEAPYSRIYSRDLLLSSLESAQDFFNGANGIADYLAFVDKGDLVDEINAKWNEAKARILDLDINLVEQVENDNMKMLAVYDKLQEALVLLKVDMLQALSIQVDYVDADGD